MEEEVQQPGPKISEVEIILIGLFYAGLDLLDLIPLAGEITDLVAAPMGAYYWMKGINGSAFLAAEILDLIPLVQEFPSRSLSWFITVYLDRHPKLTSKLAPVAAVAGAAEGLQNMGAAGEAGAAEGAIARESTEATVAAGGAAGKTAAELGEAGAAGEAAAGAASSSQAAGTGPARGKPSENLGPGENPEERGRPSETDSSDQREQREATAEVAGDVVADENDAEIQAEQDEKAQEYEKLMQTKAEQNPIDVAKEELFAMKEPERRPFDDVLEGREKKTKQAASGWPKAKPPEKTEKPADEEKPLKKAA